MDKYYLFPFGKIVQGSKIVIYGAGNVGQWFLSQLRNTAFAEVIAVADRSWQQYPQMEVRMIPPEEIAELDCEAVVIAVEKAEIAKEVKEFPILQRRHFSLQKKLLK